MDKVLQVIKSLELNVSDLKVVQNNFAAELKKAAGGENSQLSYLVTELPQKIELGPSEHLEVMALGGSNFHSAQVLSWQDQQPKFSAVNKLLLPQFPTATSLFGFIASQVHPKTTHLTINFAYPLRNEINHNKLDARLLEGTKFNAFTGLVGKLIGQELSDYFRTAQHRNIEVTVINDVTSLLLAGSTIAADVAGVLGTGFNLGLLSSDSLINLEAGDFAQFPKSPALDELKHLGELGNRASIEKETAGGYLFRHFNYWSTKCGLSAAALTSTAELSQLAANGAGTESELARALLRRSAKLAAAVLAGLCQYKFNSEVKAGINFVMEGSLFWEGWNYKQVLEDTLQELTTTSITFTKITHSYLLGPTALYTHQG